MAYATLTNLKKYLGIDEIVDDQILSNFLDQAAAITNKETGRVFIAETATKYFGTEDVENGRRLYLLKEDLLSVTTLTNGNGVVIDPSDYRLEPLNYSPKYEIYLIDPEISFEFSEWYSTITVEGSWGFCETPPEDIVWANLRLAAVLYKQKDTAIDIDRPIVTGDGITIMPSNLPADIMSVIKKYRRVI